MLKQQYQKLRLHSKSNLKRHVLQIIPVLSIFALLGINLLLFSPLDDGALHAYADEPATQADTSAGASLIIDEGKIKDTILASAGEFVYTTHKVAVSAENIKSYSLTLSGPTTITANGTTLNGAGTGTAANNLNNQWGYAWIAENDDPKTATYKSVASDVNLGDIVIDSSTHNLTGVKQLAFGAKFNSDANNGHYTTNVTLSLTATPRVVTNWKVTYNCSGGTGCPTNLDTSTDDDSKAYTIPSTTPTKSGYKFLGYGTTDATVDSNYAPGTTITLTAANPTRTLYAVWQQNLTIKQITKMQDITPDICKNTSAGESTTLTDSRDNKTYTVQKIGTQCWMVQNLALDLSVAGIASAANSDNISVNYPSTALASRYNTASTNPWTNNNATEEFSKSPKAIYRGTYIDSYGAYYSWCAATAGCKDENNKNPGSSGANIEAASSICPKGWKLPKGGIGADNDFAIMAGISSATNANQWSSAKNISYSGNTLTVNDSTWLAAGNVSLGGLDHGGDTGTYWSRTSSSTTGAYRLYFTSNNFSPAGGEVRYRGLPVRCVSYSN